LPRALPLGSGLAADGGLDRVELGDAVQGFCGHGRASGLLHIIKLPSRMRPTGRQSDGAAVAEGLQRNALRLAILPLVQVATLPRLVGFCRRVIDLGAEICKKIP